MKASLNPVRKSIQRLNTVEESLNAFFFDREKEINGLISAFLSHEHILFVGPTGTGKSALTKAFFSHLPSFRLFKTHITRDTRRDDLFGPIDPRLMREEGIVHHRINDSLADCDVAFLDEVFDGIPGILRALLTILNEREFHNHTQHIHSPLRMTVLASNFYKDKGEYEAFVDRIMFRYRVSPLTSGDVAKLLRLGEREYMPKVKLTSQDIKALDQRMREIQIPKWVLMELHKYRDRFVHKSSINGEQYLLTDRRLRVALKVVKSFTLRRGELTSSVEDLDKALVCFRVIGDRDQESHHVDVYSRTKSDMQTFYDSDGESFDLALGSLFDTWKQMYGALKVGKLEVSTVNGDIPIYSVIDALQMYFMNNVVPGNIWGQLETWGIVDFQASVAFNVIKQCISKMHLLLPEDPTTEDLLGVTKGVKGIATTLRKNLVHERI